MPLTPAPQFVALRYPPDPEGHEYLGGVLLQAVGTTEYGLRRVQIAGSEFLFLEQLLGRDDQGRASWKVVAAVRLPSIAPEDNLVLALCRVNGALDEDVFAVVRMEDRPILTKVRGAWRANRLHHRFDPIPATGVACENEGYGV